MSEHSSVWLADLDQASHPGLDGDLVVDVAVVGGGITGLTTALLVQRRGMRVAVIEADRIGAGTTGHTTGKVTSRHTLIYRQLVQKHGEHRARLYADAKPGCDRDGRVTGGGDRGRLPVRAGSRLRLHADA